MRSDVPIGGERIASQLLDRVLAPYAPNARYVHGALLHVDDGTPPRLELHAECGFELPCYIAATGHFNAVECNITYNQMLYATLAESVRRGLLPELRHWTLDEFFRRQLPDVLIGDYRARFHRPIDPRRYRGWFSIEAVRPRPARHLLLLETRAGCCDDRGGECWLEVVVAIAGWHPA